MTIREPGSIDRLDAALIELLTAEPRVGVLEASKRLNVARGNLAGRPGPDARSRRDHRIGARCRSGRARPRGHHVAAEDPASVPRDRSPLREGLLNIEAYL